MYQERAVIRAGDKQMMYVVCYDIADNRRRGKVFNLLKDFGSWVQLSVFECDISRDEAKELMSKVKKIIDEEVDFVRVYSACASCLKQSIIMGKGKLSLNQDYYII